MLRGFREHARELIMIKGSLGKLGEVQNRSSGKSRVAGEFGEA